jgi:hypothetical protein
MATERTHELLRRSGYHLTDRDIEHGRELLERASGQMTPELAAQADALLAKYRRDA